MLVWLFQRVGPLLESLETHTSGDSRVFLTARTALASVTAFLLALLLGPKRFGGCGIGSENGLPVTRFDSTSCRPTRMTPPQWVGCSSFRQLSFQCCCGVTWGIRSFNWRCWSR